MSNDFLHDLYEQAIELISVGIHAIDTNGKTVVFNKKMQEMQGLDQQQRMNQNLKSLFLLQPNENSLMTVLQNERPILNRRQTYWNKDGHEITALNDTFPLYTKDKLIGAIEISRDITSLEKLIYQPLRRYGEPLTFDIITAVSKEMKHVIEQAKNAAHANTPILLIGESGTGKDMIAEGIHHYLAPKKETFITLFSRQEDPALLQKIELALENDHPTTLFFERLEFLHIELQEQLLQLLINRKKDHHLLIGSTGSDPIELIATNSLSKELYYYFASFSITVPPLRNRKIDIQPFLYDYFLRHRNRYQSNIREIDEDVRVLFLKYDWPGNLKELELLLDEVTATIMNEEILTYAMLPPHFLLKASSHIKEQINLLVPHSKNELLPFDEFMKRAELLYIENAMQLFDGNITKTAAHIQMSRQNLQYRLRKLQK